jgi:hypothetical protein
MKTQHLHKIKLREHSVYNRNELWCNAHLGDIKMSVRQNGASENVIP